MIKYTLQGLETTEENKEEKGIAIVHVLQSGTILHTNFISLKSYFASNKQGETSLKNCLGETRNLTLDKLTLFSPSP